MKGVELPISTIVVIVISIIVLVAIIALFGNVWNPGSDLAKLEGAKSNACQMLASINGCKSTDDGITKTVIVNGFDADKNGRTIGGTGVVVPNCNNNADITDHDNLFTLCKCWYTIAGISDDIINDNCKKQVCSC